MRGCICVGLAGLRLSRYAQSWMRCLRVTLKDARDGAPLSRTLKDRETELCCKEREMEHLRRVTSSQ